MNKFSKSLATVLGIIGLVGAIVLTGITVWQVYGLREAAQRYGTTQQNPLVLIAITAAVALVAGIFLGFAMGLPSQSFKKRYESLVSAEAAGQQPVAEVADAETDTFKADRKR